MAEKSIQLEEIPGLLSIKKVKPNLVKTSVRVVKYMALCKLKM